MSKSESCDPKYIVQNMGTIKKKDDLVDYIADRLVKCAIPDTPTTTRKKRKMSGYNCFTKVQYRIEKKSAEQENRKSMPFKEMIKAKGWSTLSDKKKGIWKHLAEEGCPPRLWGG